MQVKELAAEVVDHLRGSLDGPVLTDALGQARMRSAAAKAQRRHEAALKVSVPAPCAASELPGVMSGKGQPGCRQQGGSQQELCVPAELHPRCGAQVVTYVAWTPQVMVDPQAAAQAHVKRQQRKAASRKRKQATFQRERSAATNLFDGRKRRRQRQEA